MRGKKEKSGRVYRHIVSVIFARQRGEGELWQNVS